MTAVQKQLANLLLSVSCCAAQATLNVATVVGISARKQGEDVRIEISLSDPVTPSVSTAKHPDRLVIDLPNSVPGLKQSSVPVNSGGVQTVRVRQHTAAPPVTRVVVDLKEAQPYVLSCDANRVIVTVSPAEDKSRRGAPAAAASGGLSGIFRRRHSADTSVAQSTPAPDLIPPPPSQTPIAAPVATATTAPPSSTVSQSQPTARNPNRGSLQEGTVFPGDGAPGAGAVPPVAGSAPVSFDTATVAKSKPAETQSPGGFQTSTGAQATVKPNSGTVTLQPPASAAAAPAPAPQGLSKTSSMTAPVSQSQPFPRSSQASAGQVAVASQSANNAEAARAPEPGLAAAAPTIADNNLESPAVIDVGSPAASTASNEPELTLRALDPNLRTVFKVKYVAEGVAYLDGGRSSGLQEGMKLEIKDSDLPAEQGTTVDPADPRVTAELQISGVAETSAVTDIHAPKRPVKAGDLAYLSSGDAQALVQQRTLSATRKYPAVVTFTEGDPLDEEARAEVPRPPLPSVNRARGRIGLDYMGTVSHGSTGLNSSDVGVVIRTDITRINGTFWNLSGYWRGRINSRSSSSQPTLQDLINRTYHISLTYDNPNSAWVAGFGRLYLPWAPSLETIDGGYFGRRFGHNGTLGIFGGSTPDPTSYSYNPDQKIGGAFVNFEGGSFDSTHYTSTSGVGVQLLGSQINRPFVFFENTLSYKSAFSIYDSLQADSPRGNQAVASPGPGLSRNFLTVRMQVTPRIELHFNHNYFRDIPTFDPTLIGTGLLDKYLFQGFSAGARVEVVKHVSVYADLGRSSASGDAKTSLNQLYGVTFDRIPWFGLRADAHYSRFNSSFGDGTYESLSFSRNINDALRLEVLAGQQNFTGLLSNTNRSRFLNANVESTLGRSFFVQGGFTANRGSLSYDQWSLTLGYRFDSKSKRK